MDGALVKLFVCDPKISERFIVMVELADSGAEELVVATDDATIADVKMWDAIDLHGGPRRRLRLLGKAGGKRKKSVLGSKPVALMRLVEAEEVEEVLEYVTPEDLSVEMKFNGWLVQAVRGRLYTRRGKDLTRKFPAIIETLRHYPKAHLVGELVYWNENGVMEEPAVTHVAGTKDPEEAAAKLEELPGRFQVILFDILYNGRDLAKRPTWERRQILEATVEPTEDVELSKVFAFEEWERVYRRAVKLGGDGVVFKNLGAPYDWRPLGQTESRPVGYWWKLKPVKVDDFVVYDVTRGPKGSLLALLAQYWEGELLPVGKVNNFSAEVAQEVLDRLEEGPFVMEVAYQSRFPKPPGKLQHPRFERFRDDKGPEQAELPARYAPKKETRAEHLSGAREEGEEISRDATGRLRWGREAAGLLIRRTDYGRFLLVLRSADVMDPGVFGIPGGRVELGETTEEAALSESQEELGKLPRLLMLDRDIYRSGDFTYTTFLSEISGFDADLWKPTLNWENDGWFWMSADDVASIPEKVHPNVRRVIEKWR